VTGDKSRARVIRLALDINVLVADLLSKRKNRRGSAASMLVDAVRDGNCPAGPVQFVTSVPVIENYSSVMQRHFGFTRFEAE
jgi:predicted nucleic acid-binding protein